MADVTVYFEGYDSITQTYNSGGYNQDVAFTGLASGLGSVTVVEGTGVTVTVTGLAGTSAVGSVTVTEGSAVTVTVTGNSVTATAGNTTETAGGGVSVGVTGAGVTASTNGVLIWTELDTSQTPNWTEIAA